MYTMILSTTNVLNCCYNKRSRNYVYKVTNYVTWLKYLRYFFQFTLIKNKNEVF